MRYWKWRRYSFEWTRMVSCKPIEPSTSAGVSVTFAEAGNVTDVQSNNGWPTGA